MQISNSIVKEFYTIWNTTQHPGQRLGQAFYNFIMAHRITNPKDKELMDKLYEAKSDEARKIIESITDYSN